MKQHGKINYLEFAVKDMQQAKDFFGTVFNWRFVDYGEAYTSFNNAGINGGFYLDKVTTNGTMLIVFYSTNLADTQAKIEQANGAISKSIFSFPGGRRFHFTDPSGNEFAVWSDND